jgi:hypothetical protein
MYATPKKPLLTKKKDVAHWWNQAQRALCAVSALQPEKLIPCIDALSAVIWVDGKPALLQTPEGFVPALEGVLGKDLTAKVLEKVGQHSSAKI